MLPLATLLALCAAPQGEATPPAPAVRTDANGFPQLGTPPAQPAPFAPAPGGAAAAPPAGGALRPDSLRSPLRDVWKSAGQPSDFATQGGARGQVDLHLYDAAGRVVATRVVFHDADLRVPDRDRLTFAEGRKVYGRDGAAVWAMIDGVVWHSREDEARELLAVLGLMLRVPWVFDDPRYVVYAPELIDDGGARKLRVRIETRPEGSEQLVGPALAGEDAARFELICAPQSMVVEELRYRAADGNGLRRVLLRDYESVPPGLRVPLRRVLVDPQGRRLLEVEIVRMKFGEAIPDELFRPPPPTR